MKFTLEEIWIIRSIKSKDKEKILNELKTIRRKIDDPSIVEMANNAIEKLNKATDEEFLEVLNYPL